MNSESPYKFINRTFWPLLRFVYGFVHFTQNTTTAKMQLRLFFANIYT